MLASDFDVVLLPQRKAYESDFSIARAAALVIRVDEQERVVQPTDSHPATANELAPYMLGTLSGATTARFPMSALVPGSVLRVTFSHVIRGSSALTNCKECSVPLAIASLK